MNRGRDILPLDGPDDEAADHTMMVSRQSNEATVMRRPGPPAEAARARPSGPPPRPVLDDPDDDAFPDRTMMVSRRSNAADPSGPPTEGTIVVARHLGPATEGTIVVARELGPPTDGTVVVRQSGPPTDGTVVVRQSGPPTDGTVVVRPGRTASGTAMADPVLRGRARQKSVKKPPPSIHEERPRYTPRVIPQPPGPPLQVLEGPTALRGTTPLPSVAAASRRGARTALAVWLVLSVVCAVGAVWCATQLFG